MSTVLYTNADGKEVTHSSYSSRQTFKKCPREFQLERVNGWWDKEQRAAPLFGKCIEAGLQAYEESCRTPGAGVRVFHILWEDVKLTPDFEHLIYTACEVSWEQLSISGEQMMLLYEIKAPSLPIVKPLFQQKLRKTIFPGTNLAALENVAVLDILSFPVWNHPLLPKIDEPPLPNYTEAFHKPRELIIDVKTSGKEFPVVLVALDPQLAEYAWQTRIPDVAFLWFVKVGHGFKRGSRVTLLQGYGSWRPGSEVVVFEINDLTTGSVLYVGSKETLELYEVAFKGLRGKARDTVQQGFLDGGQVSGSIIKVSAEDVTKQRIQFAAARLTEQDMDDVGRSVAQSTVEMVRAHEQGFYEKQAGVRFPNEKCNFCSMRWICLNLPNERDKHLTRRGEEWLDANSEVDE
jgi:hypothetical protein